MHNSLETYGFTGLACAERNSLSVRAFDQQSHASKTRSQRGKQKGKSQPSHIEISEIDSACFSRHIFGSVSSITKIVNDIVPEVVYLV